MRFGMGWEDLDVKTKDENAVIWQEKEFFFVESIRIQRTVLHLYYSPEIIESSHATPFPPICCIVVHGEKAFL